jgi:hypothetical protein
MNNYGDALRHHQSTDLSAVNIITLLLKPSSEFCANTGMIFGDLRDNYLSNRITAIKSSKMTSVVLLERSCSCPHRKLTFAGLRNEFLHADKSGWRAEPMGGICGMATGGAVVDLQREVLFLIISAKMT